MDTKRRQQAPAQVGELVKSISCAAKSGLRMYYIDLRKSQAERYFVRFTQGRGYRTQKQNISIDQSDMPMLMDALESFYEDTKKVMTALQDTEGEADEVKEELTDTTQREAHEKHEAECHESKELEKVPVAKLKVYETETRKPVVIPGPHATVKYETPSGTTIEIVESFSMVSSNLRRKWFVDLKKTATRGHFITFKQKTDIGNQTIFIDLIDMEKIMSSLRELTQDMKHLRQRMAEIEEREEGRQELVNID